MTIGQYAYASETSHVGLSTVIVWYWQTISKYKLCTVPAVHAWARTLPQKRPTLVRVVTHSLWPCLGPLEGEGFLMIQRFMQWAMTQAPPPAQIITPGDSYLTRDHIPNLPLDLACSLFAGIPERPCGPGGGLERKRRDTSFWTLKPKEKINIKTFFYK